MRPTFQGSIVALVTPFRGGKVDETKLRELVDFHAAQGTDAIVPCGTTGESPTLSHDEHKRVVEIVVQTAAGRVPVVAGTGSKSTDEAIDLTPSGDEPPNAAPCEYDGRNPAFPTPQPLRISVDDPRR